MRDLASSDGPSRTVLMVAALPFPFHQGSQVYVGGMARALARRGHRVLLATYGHGRGTCPSEVHHVRARSMPGLRPWASGPHPSKLLLDAALLQALVAVLRSRPVDVVHAHHVEAPLLARMAMAMTGRRSPLVWNPHTSLAEELPAYWPRAWQRAWAVPAGRRLDAFLATQATASVGLSARAVEALRGWGARDVAHLPPGVDVDELAGGDAERARARWNPGSGPFVVYAGNADAYQDLDVLYAAMARLPEARLLVATGSPEAPIRVEASRAGLPADRLVVVRPEGFAEVRDALALADVAALPRSVCAGFPIKLLNTLGLGLPTVVARGSAQPIDGVVVVPDRDPEAMATALREVLRDPVSRREAGVRAAEAVRQEWTWARRAAELEALYERVLAVRSGGEAARSDVTGDP